MNTNSNSEKCPQCGALLSANAPGGLCANCLMQMNLADPTQIDEKTGKIKKAKAPSVEEIVPLFPQLEIIELIGQGGMGAVYKARQKELDRIVALKILPKEIGETPGFAERFSREARALAKLNHSGIVTLYEFGNADGLFFFLMEYVDGLNLRGLLNNGRIEAREALAIVPQICDALQYAHDHGIVHRDIKPENILLDRLGNVKVADFGLAKIVEEKFVVPPSGGPETVDQNRLKAEQHTLPGKIMGTPKYMSPEQVEAPGSVDHRADIYALGVVFYQMLTGEMPDKELQPPSKKVRVDVRLDEVVLHALEQKPELRYQQASLLKTEVETILYTPEETPPQRKKTRLRRMGYAGHTVASGIWFLITISRITQGLNHGWNTINIFLLASCIMLTFLLGFEAVRRYRKQAPTRAPSDRFSRKALWGASWAGWALLGLPFLLNSDMHAVPPWLRMITLMWLISIFSAFFRTTALGWIALADIRRSQDRIRGRWLAFTDALLFPLLALNGVLFIDLQSLPELVLRSQSMTVLIICSGILSLLIIYLMWRIIKRPLRCPPPSTEPKKGTFRIINWVAAASILVLSTMTCILTMLNVGDGKNKRPQQTQESTITIQPDGSVHTMVRVSSTNTSSEVLESTPFITSDQVHIERIFDQQSRLISFTAQPKSHHRTEYRLTFNQPILPRGEIAYLAEGTLTGVIHPTDQPNVFEYQMKYRPNDDRSTHYIGHHILPAGTEELNMAGKQKIKATGNQVRFTINKRINRGRFVEVNFRYLLPENTTATTNQPPSSPVLEQTQEALMEEPATSTWFYDLDKEQFLTPPEELCKELLPQSVTTTNRLEQNVINIKLANWIRQSGADIVHHGDENLNAYGGLWVDAPSEDWDTITADAVIKALPNDSRTEKTDLNFGIGKLYLLSPQSASGPSFFRTRDGRHGIIQVLEPDQDTGAISIRYRLVADHPPSTSQPETSIKRPPPTTR